MPHELVYFCWGVDTPITLKNLSLPPLSTLTHPLSICFIVHWFSHFPPATIFVLCSHSTQTRPIRLAIRSLCCCWCCCCRLNVRKHVDSMPTVMQSCTVRRERQGTTRMPLTSKMIKLCLDMSSVGGRHGRYNCFGLVVAAPSLAAAAAAAPLLTEPSSLHR